MTREEADFIGSMNMCDEISNEAYKKIMVHCDIIPPWEDCISRQAVLEIITEQERLASDRVRDTPSSLDNGLHTWVNPAYTKYSTQLSERSQFKTMIQTMPSVTPQQKMLEVEE